MAKILDQRIGNQVRLLNISINCSPVGSGGNAEKGIPDTWKVFASVRLACIGPKPKPIAGQISEYDEDSPPTRQLRTIISKAIQKPEEPSIPFFVFVEGLASPPTEDEIIGYIFSEESKEKFSLWLKQQTYDLVEEVAAGYQVNMVKHPTTGIESSVIRKV
jgi:hypothetical protein